jgi:hypothetical protein
VGAEFGGAGAVYLFARSGTAWSQQVYIKAIHAGADDLFGSSVALSADGSTLAVGVRDGAGSTTVPERSAAYVFARSGTTWRQEVHVTVSSSRSFDLFGHGLALSGDGSTLALGADLEDGGAVYVFARSGAAWSQRARVTASDAGPNDVFGRGVALSVDGSTLAVGAIGDASAATGIDGDRADASAPFSGAVHVFVPPID